MTSNKHSLQRAFLRAFSMRAFVFRLLRAALGDRSLDLIYWYFFFRRTPRPRSGKRSLLILNHVFDQDIEALERANKHFELIVFDASILRFAATQLFPHSIESYAVYNDPVMVPTIRRYRAVAERLVEKLLEDYGIAGVVSPSDNFFYVRELVRAFQARGIPFIVSDKEGTICPAYFVHFAEYIKRSCPLLADHILVWSERQRAFWEKTGVSSNRITVTGQPRSDFWKQPARWLSKDQLGLELRAEAKLLLFFTYDPWAYTPDYMIEKGEMHWGVLRNETHRKIFSFAKAHPEIDVVIKAHPQQSDPAALHEEIQVSGDTNIHLATGPRLSSHLIVNADCIVGFQTTALIESMITNKPIIYTFWGEAREKWANDLIPFHKTKGVRVACSPADLFMQIENAFLNTTITPTERGARQTFVSEYLYLVDGHSTERTLAALDHLVRSRAPAASAMGKLHPIFANTAFNVANTAVSFVLAYAMTPIILGRLGTEDYGIWVFLGIFTITGYFSLLDFGLQGAAIKYIAEFSAKNDHEQLQSVVSATLLFFSAVGMLAGLTLFVFNELFLASIFRLPPSELPIVQSLVNILALSFLVQFPTLAFSGFIEGLQRYDFLRGMTMLTTIINYGLIFFFLPTQSGLTFMVVISVLTSLVLALAYALIAKRLLPNIRFSPFAVKTKTTKMLFSLSSKLFGSKIVGLIFNNTDKILIGIFLTVAYQTDYDIVNKFHIFLLSILSVFTQAVLPAASEFAARKNRQGLRDLMLRYTKYSSAVIMPVLLILLILPRPILETWISPEYGRLAQLVQLYSVHMIVTMLVGISSTMLVGMNKLGQVLKISIWAAILNLIISLLTIKWFGIAGLILGTTIAYLISSIMYIIAGNRIFGIEHHTFFSATLRPLLPAALATVIVLLFAQAFVRIDHLAELLGIILLANIIFFGIFFATGMQAEERGLIRHYLAKRSWLRRGLSPQPPTT